MANLKGKECPLNLFFYALYIVLQFVALHFLI